MMSPSHLPVPAEPQGEVARLRAAELLTEARDLERNGRPDEALAGYDAVIEAAAECDAHHVLAEALRRLAVLRYHGNHVEAARELCRRSADVACQIDNEVLAAEATNTLASIDLQVGELDRARENYERALVLGGHDRELRARVEQNLGILANIHGDLESAEAHYTRSLDAYDEAGNAHGRALAYHNLGMVNADLRRWAEAEHYYSLSGSIAEASGDIQLRGLCLVHLAEVDIERQQYDRARARAEQALTLYDQLDALGLKAEAYRVIGVIYRETGRPALAEARLRSAMEMSARAKAVLEEAETAQQLALLCQSMGRNQDALSLLHAAHRLFGQLDARVDLINVQAKVAALETTYLAVVKEWGQSIESSDTYTQGHCERVGVYAERVARALGLEEEAIKTVRIGAWLHDLGKVRVPHEILNKAGPLTQDEFELMKMHTVWGVEMLGDVAFPWDIKPMIRWHHERYDGTGYPDRLKGDEIPLNVQIIGIADAFDALTSTRSYRQAMPRGAALAEIERCRHWWCSDVVDAFVRSVVHSRQASDKAAA